MSKTCTQCGEIKKLNMFNKAKYGAQGHAAICRDCVKSNYLKKTEGVKRRNLVYEKDGIRYKKCTGCLVDKPISEYTQRVNTVQSKCRKCMNESRRKGTGPKMIVVEIKDGVESKECTGCGKVKPLQGYAKSNKGVGGKRSKCLECEKVLWKAYREENKERTIKASRKWREKCPEKQAEASRKWASSNPERNRVYMATKKSRERGLTSDLTPDEWEDILRDFKTTCALTGEAVNITLDHFIPISTGHGGSYKGNVYPLTSFLNNSKFNRNPFEWFQEYGKHHGVEEGAWDRLVAYLSKQNNMSPLDFRRYVDSCFKGGEVIGGN